MQSVTRRYSIRFQIPAWLRGWSIWSLSSEDTLALGLLGAFYVGLAVGLIGGYWTATGGAR